MTTDPEAAILEERKALNSISTALPETTSGSAMMPGLLKAMLRLGGKLARALLYVLQVLAGLGCAMLFLMSLAALANAAFGPTPVPDNLKDYITALHLVLILMTLPLSILQLALPKGRRMHKVMGYLWCALILTTALLSFGIHGLNGGFSFPHTFSVLTLIFVPLIIFLARRKKHTLHRIVVLSFILYFQIGAGAATFMTHRAMGKLYWPLWH